MITSSQTSALIIADDPLIDFRCRVSQTSVLIVAADAFPVRASQLAALIVSVSFPCLIEQTQCWKIIRNDGEIFAFTAHDEIVTFLGTVYKPCNSLRSTAITSTDSAGLDGGDIQASGILNDDSISAEDLDSGLFDGATVEVWNVSWGESTEIPRRLTKGIISTIEHGDLSYSMTALTAGARLQQQAILPTFTPACRWIFGSPQCGVDVEAMTVAGAVTGIEDRNAATKTRYRKFADSSRVEANGFFDFGKLVWTTGNNIGITANIKRYTTGLFELWDIMPNEIQLLDEYEVQPGCDKLKATCKDRYDNYLRFGGFNDLPGIDAISETPVARLD